MEELQSLWEAGKRSLDSKRETWLSSREEGSSMKAFAEADQQPSSSCPKEAFRGFMEGEWQIWVQFTVSQSSFQWFEHRQFKN